LNKTVWAGRFIEAHVDGPWEYVGRVGGITAAVILAIDDGHVLLVEQYRVPLGRNCIELPAGLVGDEQADESIAASALRELEEETGYRAESAEVLGEFAASPGMSSETFHLVRVNGLTRVSDGGGVDDEDIIVHRVPLNRMAQFIQAQRDKGRAMDVKLLAVLPFVLQPAAG